MAPESQNSQKNDSEWVLLLQSITSKTRLLKLVKDKQPKDSKEIPKMETESEHPPTNRSTSAVGHGPSQALPDIHETLGTGHHTSIHRRRVETISTSVDKEKGVSD